MCLQPAGLENLRIRSEPGENSRKDQSSNSSSFGAVRWAFGIEERYLPCQPIPPKFGGVTISPPKFRGVAPENTVKHGVSDTPPPKFGG